MSIATTPRESLITEPRTGANGSSNGKHHIGRKPQRQRSLLPWIVDLVLVLAIGAAVAFYAISQRTASAAGEGLTFEVAQGPMVVSVTESGTIKAAQQEILRAE